MVRNGITKDSRQKEIRSGVNQVEIKKVSVLAVVAMYFTACCSGPFGVEEMIADAGPGVAMTLLLIVPFVWGYPFALICTEIGDFMPVEGGSQIWIQKGLGEFWFGITTIKDYLWSLTCNTTYVVLAVGYLQEAIEMTPMQSYLVKIFIVFALLGVNILGLKEVSVVSTVIVGMTLITFAIITVIGLSTATYNPLEPFSNPDYNDYPIAAWGCEIAVALWMYSGFDEMTIFGGEIEDADRVIPKATILVIPLMAAVYIIPTLAGLSSIGQWRDWTEEPGGVGWYQVMQNSPIAPGFFAILFVVVACLAMSSLYNICIVTGSRCGLVLSDYDFGPKALARLSKKRGQPVVSMATLIIATILMIGTPNHQLSFSVLVMFEAFFLILHVCLTAITAAKLKRDHVLDDAPFKVPGGIKGHNIAVGSLLLFAFIFVYFNGISYFLVCVMVMMLLPILYVIAKIKWKGLSAKNPKGNPIDKRTRLAFGDLIRMGGYYLGFAVLGLFAHWFYPVYEEEQSVGYWLTQAEFKQDEFAQWAIEHAPEFSETTASGNIYVPGYYEYEYKTGLLSDFYQMLNWVDYVTIACAVIGVILLAIGLRLRKTDHVQLDALKAAGRID